MEKNMQSARTKSTGKYEIPTYEQNGRQFVDWAKLPGVTKSPIGQLTGRNTLVMLSALLDK